jgi:hypothetical protein
MDKNNLRGQFDMFYPRSTFRWGLFEPNGLALEDMNQGKSLTNDMTEVLADLHQDEGLPIWDMVIIYRDSTGIWDGVQLLERGSYKHQFYPIQLANKYQAYTEARNLNKVCLK